MSYLIENVARGEYTKMDSLDEILGDDALIEALRDGDLRAWREAGTVTVQLEVD